MNRNPGYQPHWQVNVVLIIASTTLYVRQTSDPDLLHCAIHHPVYLRFGEITFSNGLTSNLRKQVMLSSLGVTAKAVGWISKLLPIWEISHVAIVTLDAAIN